MKIITGVVCLLLLAYSTLSQTTTYSLAGVVVDDATGIGLPGAIVELHEAERVALTDSAGQFQLEGLGAGRHHVHFHLTGYSATAVYVMLPQDTALVLVIPMRPTAIELKEVLIESSLSRTSYLQQSLDLVSIRQEDLDRLRAVTLSENLSRVPGVTTIQVGSGIAKPVIRGLSGNRILVSDLGMKQEGQQWGNDHGLEIDPFAVGRMEIIKGPASLLFGSDAMGGVIHILPPAVPLEGWRSEVRTMARSNNDFIGSSVMTEANHKGNFFRLRATMNSFGDYRIPADSFTYLNRVLPIHGQRLKNTAGKELHLGGTAGVVRSWGSVKMTVSNYHQEAGLFPGIIGIPTTFSVAEDGDLRDRDLPYVVVNHFKAAVNSVVDRPRGWLQVDAGYQHNRRQEEALPHSEGYAPRPSGTTAHRLVLQTGQATVRWHADHFGAWRFIPGISASIQQHAREGFEFLLPDHRGWQAGAFLLAEYTSPNERSAWNGGIRMDAGSFVGQPFSTPVWNSEQQVTGYYERTGGVDRTFSQVSGAIGWSWFPEEQWNLKFNLGKSFRMPNAAELTINGVHHGTFRHEQGDAGLDPESGYQVDAAMVFERRSFLLRFTPFANYFDGYIYLRPEATFSVLPDGGQLYRYTQHDALFAGGEVAAEVHLFPDWHTDLSAEYVHSYNFNTGLGLPFTPPLRVLFNTYYEWEWDQGLVRSLSTGVHARIHAAQRRTDRNELPTDGYALLDLSADGELMIGRLPVDVHLAVNNVLDQRYFQHLSLYRPLGLPEQGRNVTIALRIPVDATLFDQTKTKSTY